MRVRTADPEGREALPTPGARVGNSMARGAL